MSTTTVRSGMVSARQSPEASTDWSYVVDQPSPERGPDGTPTAMLLVRGDGTATLQLGVRLDPPAADLERVREEVARTHSELPAVLIRLVPGVRQVTRVDVLATVTDTVVAGGTTSGYPPWTAVLVADLDAAAAAEVSAALTGGTGHVAVRYRIVLTDGTEQDATADLASWFPAGSGARLIVSPPA